MSFELEVKLAIYRHFAESGAPPSCDQIAQVLAAPPAKVVEVYQQLRAQRVLVLENDGVSIRMAPPFSGVATQHVVKVGSRSYFANCAWDALGIRQRFSNRLPSTHAASNRWSLYALRWAAKDPRVLTGCFTALCPPLTGGTTLSLPEVRCFSSGRKYKCSGGVRHRDILSGQS